MSSPSALILGVVPPLPAGYTYENQRFMVEGIRMHIAHKGTVFAEVMQRSGYASEGIRYTARVTNYEHKHTRPFNNPNPWVEYDNMETLVSAVLARYRIGIRNEHIQNR